MAASPSLAQPLELDANAVDDSGPGLPEDWDVVVTGGGTPMFGFLADPAGETIFSGAGSRDTQDITSWTWINGVVPSKDEITNAFFAY